MKELEGMLNQIVCGDCLEVMPDIPDKSVDMILCDLPYGTTACKWDTIIPFEPLWEQYKRIIKDNGAIVLTASQPFTSALVMSNIKMFKYEWIYKKSKASGFLDAKKKPLKQHESILVFGHKGWVNYYPQGLIDGIFKNGRKTDKEDVYRKRNYVKISTKGNYPKSVIEIKNPSGKGHEHPTQKPVALFEYLIKTYSNEGDLVLDNCAGSGTTAVACQNLKRNFIGIELDPDYCKIAEQRLKDLQPTLDLTPKGEQLNKLEE